MLPTLKPAIYIVAVAVAGLSILWLIMATSTFSAPSVLDHLQDSHITILYSTAKQHATGENTQTVARSHDLQQQGGIADKPPLPTLHVADRGLLKRLGISLDERPIGTAGLSVIVTKTVGATPEECAPTNEVTVATGSLVIYCYLIVNTSNVTLTRHTVVDDKIGILLPDVFYELTPYSTETSSAFFILPVAIENSTTNTVVWTASTEENQVVTATDKAWVRIPQIVVTETVSLSPQCGDQNYLTAPRGSAVTFCYTAYNTGTVTFTLHTVYDSKWGEVATNLTRVLAPGRSTQLTITKVITESVHNAIQWTGRANNGIEAVAAAEATVRVAGIELTATVSRNPNNCSSVDSIRLFPGEVATLCYYIRNNGGTTFEQHQVVDSLGSRNEFTYSLPPDFSFGIQVTTAVIISKVATVTWTAFGPNNATAVATDTIYLIVPNDADLDVRVYYDVDADGDRDVNEPGLPGVDLRLISSIQKVLTETTDEQGIATFIKLSDGGIYTATVITTSVPLTYSLTTSKVATVSVSKERRVTATFGFAKPPTFDTDQDGVPDRLEGTADDDNDGIANFLDVERIFLPLVRRK